MRSFVKRLPGALAGLMLLATSLTARADSPTGFAAVAPNGSLPPAIVQPLPPVGSSDPRFGIVQSFENLGLASAAGSRWERAPFFWNLAQPLSASDWSPDQFKMSSAQLSQEVAAGMQVVGQIGNPPAWAVKDGSTPKNLTLAWNDPANYWGQFVYKLALTYAGQIDTWIIWNEPDFPVGHPLSTWAGTPEDYYYLLKDASQAIKAANPKGKVVFAGTTYWADVNAGRTLFFQRALEAGLRVDAANAQANGFYFDAVDIHLYSTPLDLYRIPAVYKQIMTNLGLSKPIWISETNVLPYDDPGNQTPPGMFRSSMLEQADYVIRAFAMAIAAGVEKVSLYKLIDGDVTEHMPWGLVRNDGSLRPEYVGYQVAVSHFSNPGTVTYSNANGIDTIMMDRGDNRTWVLINTAPTAATGSVPYLSRDSTLTTNLGASSPLPVPQLAPGQVIPQVNINLPGATNGLIGGDPMIIDEKNIPEEIDLSPESVFFPRAGHALANGILDYWRAKGGLGHFGQPTSDETPQADRTVQTFAKGTLEAFPAFQGTSYAVQEGTGKASPVDATTAAGGPSTSFFKLTGHNVGFAFLRVFNDLGGVNAVGYPRTEALTLNGQTVQFFQRAVMEYHPEAASTAGEVVLRPLGSLLTQGQTFGASQSTPNDADHQYFPSTKHLVAFGFLHFYQSHNGAKLLGDPISDAFQDAQGHTLQYFQGGRMEYHPEAVGTPNEVQLGLVGDDLLHKMNWL